MRNGIVVRNNFANVNESKYGMGRTPDKFVTNYAARVTATEPLSPLESAQQIAQIKFAEQKYPKRDRTTKQALYRGEWPNYLYRKLRRADNWNGRTFGNLSLSYQKSTLQNEAKKIRRVYKQGHSVNESVISFTDPYLKKMGVMDKNFRRSGRGSLFGHVDQLKLRKAITHGLNNLTTAGNYTKPLWIGAIQLDTLHAHCHLVLADDVKLSQSKRLIPRKYQDKNTPMHLEDRGKMTSKEKNSLADGINSSLEGSLSLSQYQTQPTLEKANMLSHVDDLVAYQALTNSRLQEVLASLPSDQNKWSMDNKSPEMRHSNRLMNAYLNNMILEYGDQIGYPETVDHLQQYSYAYQKRYHVSDHQRQHLYHRQVQGFRHHLGNIAYDQLGTIVKHQTLSDQTGYLQASSESLPELQNEIAKSYQGKHVPHIGADMFVYRLNSYPRRYRYHINMMRFYHDASTLYDREQRRMNTTKESRAMQNYYRTEFMHHARLTDKYRFMIDRNHDDHRNVSDMDIRRSQLDEQRKNLNQIARSPELGTTLRESNLMKAFCRDKNNQVLMKLPVNSQHRTLKSALSSMENNHTVRMSDIMQRNLVAFCQRTKKYNGLVNVFSRMNRLQEDNLTSNAVADYADSYNDYTYRGLVNGTLNHQQYKNVSQVYNSAIKGGHILTPPKAMPRSRQLKPRIFNDVKSDDMSDTIYDLSPHANRDVDPEESQKYAEQTEIRYQRAEQAQAYLKRAHEASAQLERRLRRIRLQRQIANEINRRKRLPIIIRKRYLHEQRRANRLGRSIDARHAYHYSRINVSEWHHQSVRENQTLERQEARMRTPRTPVTPG